MTEKNKKIKKILLMDDIRFENDELLRISIMDDDIEIFEFLLLQDEYDDHNSFLNNELLMDTINFFASDSINEIIKKRYF